jgi:hypothetical protein
MLKVTIHGFSSHDLAEVNPARSLTLHLKTAIPVLEESKETGWAKEY